MGASQQRKTAAVRAKQLIKLIFAVSSEIAPSIIKPCFFTSSQVRREVLLSVTNMN